MKTKVERKFSTNERKENVAAEISKREPVWAQNRASITSVCVRDIVIFTATSLVQFFRSGCVSAKRFLQFFASLILKYYFSFAQR